MSLSKLPHVVDRHVGSQIRLARRRAGIAQMDLALRIGVTFQQVQKYESGANRISASKLYATAIALGRGIDWFYECLSPALTPRLAEEVCAGSHRDLRRNYDFLEIREGALIAAAMSCLSVDKRSAVLGLVRALAKGDTDLRLREDRDSHQSADQRGTLSRVG